MKNRPFGWKISGRSVVGLKHEKHGLQCQDYVRYFQSDQLTIITLADGASSSNYAAIGAKKSCNLIIDYFKKNTVLSFNQKNELKHILITQIQDDLSEYAGENKTNIYELSSTLLFVALYKNQFIAGHIGDGVIGMSKNNRLQVLSKPENDEFANVTYFTSSRNLQKHLRIRHGTISPKDQIGFILMSDGAAKSFYNKPNAKFSSGVDKLFNWMKEYEKSKMNNLIYDNLESVIRHNTSDDCSILIATKT